MSIKWLTIPEYQDYWKTALTNNAAAASERYLGQVREEETTSGTKRYKWVRAGATIAKGAPVHYSTTAGTKVAVAASAVNTNKVAGVAVAALTISNYGWIQIGGFCSYVLTDKGVVAGDRLVKDEATDGMTDTQAKSAAGTQFGWTVLGVALATDSGSVCPAVMLSCAG